MSSITSSPSPPVSSLKAPSLAEAPEVREEMEVDATPSTSTVTANVSVGSGLDMSAISALFNSVGGLNGVLPAQNAPSTSTAAAPAPAPMPNQVPQQPNNQVDLSMFQNNAALQALLTSGHLGALATAFAAAQRQQQQTAGESSAAAPAPPVAPMAAPAPIEPKVETPTTPSTFQMPPVSATPLNAATLHSLITSTLTPDAANKSISKLFGKDGEAPTGEPVKKSRLKVFANGYFMTFDKISSCQKKHFWRCEYKNTCKARMHTDILTDHISPPLPILDPMDTKFRIATFIHDHNHSPPTDEEIRLYGLDPCRVQHDFVYLVNNNADPNQRRKIRKQVAEAEAAARRAEAARQEKEQQEQTVAAIASARAAIAQAAATSSAQPCVSTAAAVSLLPQAAAAAAAAAATSSGMMNGASSSMVAQLPYIPPSLASIVKQEPQETASSSYIPPSLGASASAATTTNPLNLLGFAPSSMVPLSLQAESPRITASGAVKRRATPTDEELARDPMFEPTFQIARKLRRLWQGEPLRYPKTTPSPTRYLEFYIAKKDSASADHLYVPMRIEQRDETMLKTALQEFSGEVCGGLLIYGVSASISIMFNQPMIHNWENGQFFLLDTSNPTRWRLQFVDDRTA